jgi:hypothetical protein
MNIFQKVVAALSDRHWVHKGEMAGNVTYLSATFFGAHGVASMAAGALALILIIGMVVSHAIE